MLHLRNYILGLFLLLLTACGSSVTEQVSLFDKQVPVTEKEALEGEETESVDLPSIEEKEPSPIEPLPEIPKEEEEPASMSLRDKVLENSDVSEDALDKAFSYYDENVEDISNREVLSIFDIGKHSGEKRYYIIDLETGDVDSFHVAHGRNSDKDHDGWATEFSNTDSSYQSSLGFMLTGSTYYGSNGYSLNLHGLENRNDNVYSRRIVIHGSDYVGPQYSRMGRSLGCPAVSHDEIDDVINRTRNGSLYYIYHEDYE